MVEKLWATITSRNEVMEIAEGLIPYFKTQIKDSEGNTARFASIQDVEFSHQLLGDVNTIMAKITILSDAGPVLHDIRIREFKEIEILEEEIRLYNELGRRTKKFQNIKPTPLIEIDKTNKHLVYELNLGKTLDQIDLPIELRNFLVGRIFAMVQGDISNSLNIQDIKNLIDYLKENLPLTQEENETITQLFEIHYARLEGCMGGYQPCTLFDPDLIEFNTDIEGEIDMRSIYNNEALYLSIPMQQPEGVLVDRMSAIASFFYKNVYAEFISTGDIINTRDEILIFLEGYNSVTNDIGLPSIKELYPNGLTLELQMLIVFWIMKYRGISYNQGDAFTKDDVRFSYFLLLKNPFAEIIQ